MRFLGLNRSSAKTRTCDGSLPCTVMERAVRILGYAGADEPELARSVIFTNFATSHQNAIIASENCYVNINLHTYLSAVLVHHFGEVTQRLATILPREALASLSIEVLQIPARQVARESVSAPRIPAPEQR